METAPTVLISGAGVAGPALAFWLTRYGYRVVVVELATEIRPGGQTVDLRGAGADVVERMGLLEQMQGRALEQRGIAWVRSDGSRRAEMPVEAFDGNGLVSKLEILRGDLVEVLFSATRDSVDYRFGTRVSAMTAADDGVDVVLSDGTEIRVDLLVGADGPHSAVRRLAFGPEEQFVEPLGGYNAWFSAPDTIGLDGWYLMYQAPGGRNASLRPSHDPTTAKAGLAFRSEPLEYDRHDQDAQRRLLAERMAGAGWHTDELLAAAAHAPDFYFDAFAQVKMDRWSAGRITLVGDAGYCASPLSGMGTSLALVGAYLLAGELGPAPATLSAAHVDAALASYETRMRPYVERCQELPNSVERFLPESANEIAVGAAVMKWMQRWPLRPLAARKWFTTAESVDLPDYPVPPIAR
ncbi:MAG TPA: FAD-dependent monooxygenase [Gordonia sp. (in: high G+C Gram-positive bacteria)]|uniref:FAD-dependent monooxygenase n=1 Tax=unclassified Gordonia (in: high G+C Gram-positive bacteria) TaxID=2657482 RepID=UPI000F998D63|nr:MULTISPECIES: FAD-dependent monooxygenase [unclassified Gordonia (in: high G+C Gram-positive bacteria)]RUP40509.1 MAG: FAD-binding monooxygenase [Gordonia sp. (in: high G+C Gram-positive bacteria)]HNP57557.1 FAD-dependent monooxygenase [Gordonia sp. (in: high G+C Gram-positive bacteria)]HRC49608.1 FAD-dependent monooxygenase [Gordonia sp. (in: high G+C Gram-positive bacteria)]